MLLHCMLAHVASLMRCGALCSRCWQGASRWVIGMMIPYVTMQAMGIGRGRRSQTT